MWKSELCSKLRNYHSAVLNSLRSLKKDIISEILPQVSGAKIRSEDQWCTYLTTNAFVTEAWLHQFSSAQTQAGLKIKIEEEADQQLVQRLANTEPPTPHWLWAESPHVFTHRFFELQTAKIEARKRQFSNSKYRKVKAPSPCHFSFCF